MISLTSLVVLCAVVLCAVVASALVYTVFRVAEESIKFSAAFAVLTAAAVIVVCLG